MLKAKFKRQDVQIEQEKTAFGGFFKLDVVTLKHRLFGGGWSPAIEREIFRKAEAAAAILYDPKRDLIGLVEQFRVGCLDSSYGPWSLEGVAGMVEQGESAEAMVLRELQEEAGIDRAELLPITAFYPSPGSCNEFTHLYCAICDLADAGGNFGLEHEGEDILFHTLAAEEVFAAMLQDRTNNAATLIGLQWLYIHRPELQARYS